MTIRIDEQVLSGNLGDGWKDEYEAANGYAKFLETRIREKITEWYPESEIVVNIDVQRASGAARPMMIIVDGTDSYDVESEIEDNMVYVLEKAWSDWLESKEAEPYIA